MVVKSDTIIRTVVLALALINQILVATNHSVIPVNDEDITQLITLVFTIGASVWAWWKNNSFTHEALVADQFMEDLKREKEGE